MGGSGGPHFVFNLGSVPNHVDKQAIVGFVVFQGGQGFSRLVHALRNGHASWVGVLSVLPTFFCSLCVCVCVTEPAKQSRCFTLQVNDRDIFEGLL